MTAPRPRVEGEAVRRPLDRTLVRLYAEFTDAECAIHGDAGVVIRDLALNVLDERASIASLTAEVERLTKEKEAVAAIASEAIAAFATSPTTVMRYDDAKGCHVVYHKDLAARLAALSLPTPAPEAKE